MTEIRFATFNASLNREAEGQLIIDLSATDNEQAKAVAEIIQRVNPDVLLVNEFDFDADGEAAELFQENYLGISQNGVEPVEYPFVYLAPSNTGIASGFDLDNNGEIVSTPGADGYGNDALGFGNFPGQFGMVVYSKFPIVEENVRTFQNFLWKDMPGALLPDNLDTPEEPDWYSEEELEVFPLSSKSHWDIPIEIDGEIVHVLASHPTPPVFDGEEDRNGRRNHDEIRLFADYITPGEGDYIYDDEGNFGGLEEGSNFVIMGDQNADPFDGDSFDNAINQLLNNSLVNTSVTPSSEGGVDASDRQGGENENHEGDPVFDTADFNDAEGTSGNLRADYVLPSATLEITDAEVFWPPAGDPLFDLVGDFPFPSSDHRLVSVEVDLQTDVGGEESGDKDRKTVSNIEFIGDVEFETGFEFNETEVGGLSGLSYDPDEGIFYAISDAQFQNNDARFYTLEIDLNDGSLDDGDLEFVEVTTLLNEDGEPFPENSVNTEAIALENNSLFISSTDNVNESVESFIGEFSLEGQQLTELEIPDKFLPDDEGTQGTRNNSGFRSLSITPDKRFLYTATDAALVQDASSPTLENENVSRIIKYDLTTGEAVKEFAYITDAIPEDSPLSGEFPNNALVELVAIDNSDTLLALERSFVDGTGSNIQLYEVQLQNTTNIQGFESLINPDDPDGNLFDVDAVAEKRLLLDFGELGINLDNDEGMSFGPILPDGSQSLIVVSDNNFNESQVTQFLGFSLDLDTIPLVEPAVETP